MSETDSLLEIPLVAISHNADQNVRQVNSNDESVRELAESIRQQGILEPLVVVKGPNGGYRLVFGFRRAAAARLAGLKTVPAIVRSFNDQEIREAQLVENLQREDLTPIDEARALKILLEANGHTQAELGKRIGKSQPYVANRLRLLELPEKGQQLLNEGKISTAVAQQILRVPREEKGAVGSVLRKIEETLGYRGVVGDRDLKWAVDRAIEGVREKKAVRKILEGLKFPNCPKKDCGKPGRLREHRWNPQSRELTCPNSHVWSGTTGKIDTDRASYGRSEPQKPPTLPEVDVGIPTTLTVQQVAKRILESIQGFQRVELSWLGGKTAEIHLSVDLGPAKGARVPSFEFEAGHKFVTMDDARYQPTDERRKDAAQQRAQLEAWLGTFGRPKKGG